ncbi:hypothetical protein [Aquibacillus sediminis]|uniref:hypothetical protein n=1 Tax=Aquibacillus sediminis TaxID=2574734 RepID=UPI0011088D0D|nr:hypothetical protein [Aquibacillus sediminis]
MTTTLLIILLISIIQTFSIFSFVLCHRNHLPKMTGMLVSMSLGMSVGLWIGVIFGIIWTGNLFQSTVYAILIGLTVGYVTGMPIGLIAVIDGALSGLMGGMMGAMLGDMIAMSHPDTTIKLLSFIISMILTIVLYTIGEQIQNKTYHSFWFVNHSFLMLFIITAIYFGLSFTGPVFFGH